MAERKKKLERRRENFIADHTFEMKDLIIKHANKILSKIKIHEANEKRRLELEARTRELNEKQKKELG